MNSAVTDNARISEGTRDSLREMAKYYGCYSQDLSGLCITLFVEEHLVVTAEAAAMGRTKNCKPFISQNIAARLGAGIVGDSIQLGLIVETGFDYFLQNPNCIEQLKVLSSPTRGVIVEIPDSLQLPQHNVARFVASSLLRSTGIVATTAPPSSRHVSVVLQKEDLRRLRNYLPAGAGLGWLLAPPDLGLTVLAIRTCSKTGGTVHDMRWGSDPVKVLLPRVKDQGKMQLELVRYLTQL
jgi:hypothetical protein